MRIVRAAVLASLAATVACSQMAEHDKAHEQASTMGKYKVRLTTEVEKVTGTCTYVGVVQPDLDPVQIPPDDQLPDYFRVGGVLLGADTVIVKGRIGEAYVCGPSPLNPDGTPQHYPATATPQ